jgi:hypothetical protein
MTVATELNNSLVKWISVILFLRLVSRLVSQTEASSVANILTSLVGMTFILKLSWTLLSRHLLPYRVQDHVSLLISLEYKRAVAEWMSRWREHVGSGILAVRRLFGDLLESMRHATRREPRDESIEMGATNVPQESLVEAPTPNEMERDSGHEEIVPQLQEKKKS